MTRLLANSREGNCHSPAAFFWKKIVTAQRAGGFHQDIERQLPMLREAQKMGSDH